MFPKLLLILVLLGSVSHAQVRVILDTDIDSDVDDVQALAMLHTYRQAGLIDLLGVVVTSDDSYSFACVDAINTYYGKPGLPIGFLKNQDSLRHFSKYTRQLADEFPHTITQLDQTIESATLYRKLLAESPDNSVVLVTVGHLTSLQNLLQSPPDTLSTLTGQELVRKKVKRWLCMGGQYPAGKEANFYRPDPQSTVYCLDAWEQEVIFCGWEAGKEIMTGGTYLRSKLSQENPMYRAYQLYNNFAGRPAWDQVAVMLLDKKAGRYFELESNGYVEVAPDGSNTWKMGKKKAGKNHTYVKIRQGISPEIIARSMDDLSIQKKFRNK
jgi:inosine-uridine nucleoside N-ribohydrolase